MPPRYDPRYVYPRGYDYGNVALGLADLLGQGFDRLHRWNQDEQGQQNKQDDYLLRLQQMLGQEQDRTLDRDLKQKQIEDLLASRKTQADQAAASRSAIGKFIGGLGQDVPTQEPAPQPPPQATAISPQAADRTLGQFMYGKRKATPQESMTALGPDAANLPEKFVETMLKFYEGKKAAAPKIEQRDPTKPLVKIDPETGAVTELAPGMPEPPKPKEPPAPSAERDWHAMATDQLTKELGRVPTEPEVAARARKLSEDSATRHDAATAGAIEKARLDVPNPMRAEESKVWRQTLTAQGKLDDIAELVQSPNVNLSKIAGGIQPWVNEVIQTGKIGPIPIDPKLFGGPLTREENMLLGAMYDAADLTLRQRSGAQINEQEFKRMLQFLAAPGVRPEVILDRLQLQRHNNERELDLLEHQARESKFIVPSRPTRKPLLTDDLAAKKRRIQELEQKARE